MEPDKPGGDLAFLAFAAAALQQQGREAEGQVPKPKGPMQNMFLDRRSSSRAGSLPRRHASWSRNDMGACAAAALAPAAVVPAVQLEELETEQDEEDLLSEADVLSESGGVLSFVGGILEDALEDYGEEAMLEAMLEDEAILVVSSSEPTIDEEVDAMITAVKEKSPRKLGLPSGRDLSPCGRRLPQQQLLCPQSASPSQEAMPMDCLPLSAPAFKAAPPLPSMESSTPVLPEVSGSVQDDKLCRQPVPPSSPCIRGSPRRNRTRLCAAPSEAASAWNVPLAPPGPRPVRTSPRSTICSEAPQGVLPQKVPTRPAGKPTGPRRPGRTCVAGKPGLDEALPVSFEFPGLNASNPAISLGPLLRGPSPAPAAKQATASAMELDLGLQPAPPSASAICFADTLLPGHDTGLRCTKTSGLSFLPKLTTPRTMASEVASWTHNFGTAVGIERSQPSRPADCW
eukprot:TRINITY_DN64282_c0_g1_i1.p1 TRINITY_DN64282_c0_g1~~TRINITY_DN64282_c0_g1_i1.p1  ORF type:complete len:457 (-),score=102.91 TRINITY_DN64282_c0_g1_i1:36-1406(-)